MRRISLGLASVLVIMWSSVGAQGATITGSLFDFNAADQTPGSVHSIGIYLKTDVPNGISAVEMDITTAGSGKVNFGTQHGATKDNSTSSAFATAHGYTVVKPNLSTDGSGDTSLWNPKPVVGAALDGDFDMVGFSLISTPGDVDSDPNDHAALGQTQTGKGDLAGIAVWVYHGTEVLNLYLASAQYFTDTTGGTTTANQDFPAANVHALPYVNGLLEPGSPEPTSFVLLGLGGLGLLTCAKRGRR